MNKAQRQIKSTHLTSIFALISLFLAFLIQCASAPSIDKAGRTPIVRPESVLPLLNPAKEELLAPKITFPKAMLSVAYIGRSMAEMRVGPGTQFRLKDKLLPKGHQVVLLDRVGAWQKVIAVGNSQIGWVHYVTLGKIELNTKPVTLKSNLLPRVFATRRLKKAFPYGRKDVTAVATDIPKGKSFIAVRYKRDKVLVYLPSTNSVVWLTGGIVQ